MMRLWSLHPQYLDAKGLVALWREALLAQQVLRGTTRGYKNHPQLQRFTRSANPLGALAEYLRHVEQEAARRGYRFDTSKIGTATSDQQITVTSGQLAYEGNHLLAKLASRQPALSAALQREPHIKPHPLFTEVPGPIEDWEKI